MVRRASSETESEGRWVCCLKSSVATVWKRGGLETVIRKEWKSRDQLEGCYIYPSEKRWCQKWVLFTGIERSEWTQVSKGRKERNLQLDFRRFLNIWGVEDDSSVSGLGHWVNGGTSCGEELLPGGKQGFHSVSKYWVGIPKQTMFNFRTLGSFWDSSFAIIRALSLFLSLRHSDTCQHCSFSVLSLGN